MAKKSILAVFLILFLGISLIVGIPIFTLSIQLSTYDVIDVSDDSYMYTTSNSSEIQELNINSDVGDIRLHYVDARVKHAVVIEVNFMMVGSNLAGKTPSEYFSIDWQNSSSPLNFTLELKSESLLDYSSLLVKDFSIIVSIREDLIFDMNIKVKEGDVEIVIPWGVSINDLLVNVTKGDIFYDFEFCTIQGNIIGFVDEGNIDFRTYDAKYTQNSNWNFTLDTGDLTINISQNRDLGVNLTGTAKINKGNVLFLYEDNSPNIGMRFEIPFGSDTDYHPNFPQCLHEYIFWGMCSNVVGFHYNDPDLSSNLSSVKLTSLDFLENRVKYYYDLRFEIFQGSFNMGALTSIN
ncbi:hypothetical protein LCGC14_1707270 [marine sediment metagenome]|uniref:Adhesin domain-containing protein n=1 Tax=marine sediment metagenome TaxID=412755 RepID=A0A0F9KGA9_9ZZZZ